MSEGSRFWKAAALLDFQASGLLSEQQPQLNSAPRSSEATSSAGIKLQALSSLHQDCSILCIEHWTSPSRAQA